MRRALLILAVVALAGCVNETPLDPHVGRVLATHHRDGYEDCGYDYRYSPANGDYGYYFGCDWVDDEWTMSVDWEPRRFRDDDTGKIRTDPGGIESGFQIDEGVFDDCRRGEWFHDEAGGRCSEGFEQ